MHKKATGYKTRNNRSTKQPEINQQKDKSKPLSINNYFKSKQIKFSNQKTENG